jgi:hypothetical protein
MKSILSLQEHAAGTFFPPALERKIRRGDGKDEQHQHTHTAGEEEEENPSTAAKKC